MNIRVWQFVPDLMNKLVPEGAVHSWNHESTYHDCSLDHSIYRAARTCAITIVCMCTDRAGATRSDNTALTDDQSVHPYCCIAGTVSATTANTDAATR